jgi:hypothetical protein
MSLIGPARSPSTRTTASSTQPGRRGRSRRLVMARGWASLALRPSSFSARRLNPDRASCAASAARSSDTILSIEPRSWFQYPPLLCIGTRSGPARPIAVSADSAAPKLRAVRIWLASDPARSACAAGGPIPRRSAHATWRALSRLPHGSHAHAGDVPDRAASRRDNEPKMLQILARASP